MLHGRDSELALLRARLASAREGQSFAVVVAGEAGIGKTALLQAVLEDVEGFRVLRARGYEGEAEIPYAGLLELVRPLLHLADALPVQQAAALRSALALGPPTGRDRFAVPVALLGLLGAAAEEGPLLVVVDDAHWLDAATREAVLFAARRLRAEGAGVLLGVRQEPGGPLFDAAGLEVLALGGLDAAGARALLEGTVAAPVADALADATGGNPLALVELPAVLSEDERRGRRPLSTTLAAGGRIEQLFSDRVAALPPRTRAALGAAAAVEDGALDQLFGALERLGLAPEDLGPAEQQDVVTIRGAQLAFRHPLVRAAAYEAQTVAQRHAVHAALADAATDGRAAAWHRAQAATGPDEDVAAALAAAGADALERGGRSEAARTFARAADLTPDPATAAHRRLTAALVAHDAGEVDRADALLALAEDGPLDEDRRGDARRLRALLLARAGDGPAGVRILEHEAARVAAHDPVQAAATLLMTAPAHMHVGDFPALQDAAARAAALAPADEALVAATADLRILARNAMGHIVPADRDALSAAAGRDVTAGLGEVAIATAEALTFGEHLDLARQRLDEQVERARGAGAVLMLMYALAVRAELHHRTGHWGKARADAEEAVDLQGLVGQATIFSGYVLAIGAVIAMDTGRMADARRLVEAARVNGARSNAVTIGFWIEWSAARLALVEGRPAETVATLQALEPARERTRWAALNMALADGDLGDALATAGDADAVRALADRLRALVTTGARLPLAVADRLEGSVAGDDAFEGHFAAALALHAEVAMPFERARTLLALGERRRRRQAGEDPVAPLREAQSTFEALGATPWAARAREALRRAGSREQVQPGTDPALVLSGQEWRIAQLVAEGMTNKQVAGEIFLSPKTIEHHLSAIYRKLGVRSRTQLAQLFARQAAA